jgi:hypothetical protein
MNEKELEEKIIDILLLPHDKNITVDANCRLMINKIIALCRTHFGRVWWEEMKGEFRTCLCSGANECVYTSDIKRILMGGGKEMILKLAVRYLCFWLRKDINYRYSWQANIAMVMFDRIRNDMPLTKEKLHRLCNEGADEFLKILTR